MRKRSKLKRLTALRTLKLLVEAPEQYSHLTIHQWLRIRDALIEHLQALIVAGRK
jgi:hypothetical protein